MRERPRKVVIYGAVYADGLAEAAANGARHYVRIDGTPSGRDHDRGLWGGQPIVKKHHLAGEIELPRVDPTGTLCTACPTCRWKKKRERQGKLIVFRTSPLGTYLGRYEVGT